MGVDGESFVRVYNYNEEARVGVDHLGLIASFQIPKYRGVIEEGQVDHVLALLELRRVDLANLRCFVVELLMSDSHHTFRGRILQAASLQQTLPVPSGLGTRNPDRGLRVVGLVAVIPPALRGRQEVL